MSIRIRLVIMCLLVALLPAVPLTVVVKSLLDKSFDIGLHASVEESLDSGLSVSRKHLGTLRRDFSLYVQRTADAIGEARPDSAEAAATLARTVGASGKVDGLLVAQSEGGELPGGLKPFAGHPVLEGLLEGTALISDNFLTSGRLTFIGVEDRSSFIALWNPESQDMPRRWRAGDYRVLFYKKVDPEFLADANRLIEGRQNIAALKLLRQSLEDSFFYPFVIIYAVCLAIALALALLMAERLADPIRRLVRGTSEVAAGDWNYRLDIRAGGETGRLVDAFNEMVARLDTQHRRLADMEKMATWREMARHLAHEIKNPLLPIRLTIEELRDMYQGDDPRFKEMLEDSTRIVGDELDSLQKLVKEFSSFARMPDMTPVPGSLEQLTRDVARLYPGIDVSIESAGGPPEFPFDPDQIRRVLVNLFDNAASVGATRIDLSLGEAGGEAVLTFADNGPGIGADNLGRIFDPYFTTREEGTGLGLAMTKKIVLLHGGSIIATNREGAGVTFEVRLPLTNERNGNKELT